MTPVLIAAAVVLLLVGAGALAMAVIVIRATQRIIRRRVDIILPRFEGPDDVHSGASSRVTGVARSIFSIGVDRSWDSRTRIQTLVLSSLCAGLLTWAVLSLVLRAHVWIWGPAVLVTLMIPPQILLRLEQARMGAKFTEILPDTIDMIVRMLRAGLPLSSAIRQVATESRSPMKEVFASISDRMTIGASFNEALISSGKRIRLGDFRFFVVAASLQQSTGGNLAFTLETLSEIVRRRRSARLKARAVTAEVRMSAYVLAAIPFVIVLGMLVISPGYLRPLVVDPRGHLIVGIAIGALMTGFFVMRQMMRSVLRS